MVTMHPGEYLRLSYIERGPLDVAELASRLEIPLSELNALIAEERCITGELAIRLEKVLGRSAESWLSLQSMYELATARKAMRGLKLIPYDFALPLPEGVDYPSDEQIAAWASA
ncbi:HigA family addiction module antitoxin [Massilia sp. BJB1822]|uniref:HigA family addiction module antitoxin n=1 Tax=Massilia sp. BJB1822 TaxID=2744470 RepID=UPI0015948618|nr:HigA family addiction module antitoxin [Massilia sp. BJB1822]NVD99806.1 HigA family addiction module antidote protein [Massilia sp. BJB1822]